MMRTRHNLVVEKRIQEAFEPVHAIRATTGSERGVDKITPLAVDDRKIAQNFARWKHEGGTKLIGAEFETRILRFATTNRTLCLAWDGVEAAAIFIFLDGATKKLRQGTREFSPAQIGHDLRFRNGGGFLEAARGYAVFDVGPGPGKWCEVTFQDVAAMMGKMDPTIRGRRHRANRVNLFLLALEPDDAKGRAHAGDFRDEQLGHDA